MQGFIISLKVINSCTAILASHPKNCHSHSVKPGKEKHTLYMKSRRVFEKIKITTSFETECLYSFCIPIVHSRMGIIRYKARASQM